MHPFEIIYPPNPSKQVYRVRRSKPLVFIGISQKMTQPTTLQIFRTTAQSSCKEAPPSHRGGTNQNPPSRTRSSCCWSLVIFPYVNFSLNTPLSNPKSLQAISREERLRGRRLVGVRFLMYTSAAPLRARSGGVSQNDALRFDVLPVFDVIRIGGPPVLATCSRPGGGEKANFGVGPIPRDRDDRAPFATRLRAGHPPRAFPHQQPKFAICASAANEATTRVVGGLAFPLIASREIRNPGGDSSHATPRDGIRECAYQLAFLSSMHLPT